MFIKQISSLINNNRAKGSLVEHQGGFCSSKTNFIKIKPPGLGIFFEEKMHSLTKSFVVNIST